MLREKLQSVGSDLIDAKTRVTELENGQAADREALRLSNARLSEASALTVKRPIRSLLTALKTSRSKSSQMR